MKLRSYRFILNNILLPQICGLYLINFLINIFRIATFITKTHKTNKLYKLLEKYIVYIKML